MEAAAVRLRTSYFVLRTKAPNQIYNLSFLD